MFCYDVFDTDSGELLGSGCLSELSDEAGFTRASQIWDGIYPARKIHVEEITWEQYKASMGIRATSAEHFRYLRNEADYVVVQTRN